MSNYPKFREQLNSFAFQSAGIIIERFDGTLAPISLDDPGSTSRTLADDEILVNKQKKARIGHILSPMSELITSIHIMYKKIHPLDDEYAATKHCYRSGFTLPSGESLHNFDSEGNNYAGYLETAHEALGEERPYTLRADKIRDEATAELLAKRIVEFRYKPLVILTASCTFSVLNIEIGDKIATNLTYIPSAFNNYTWLVTGQRIVPHIGSSPEVRLVLLELGSATLPSVTVWQDHLTTGDAKTDKLSTGDVITEVL